MLPQGRPWTPIQAELHATSVFQTRPLPTEQTSTPTVARETCNRESSALQEAAPHPSSTPRCTESACAGRRYRPLLRQEGPAESTPSKLTAWIEATEHTVNQRHAPRRQSARSFDGGDSTVFDEAAGLQISHCLA